MKLLTPEQAQDLITLVQETQIVAFFERLQQLGIETTEISNFKKEFIFGVFRFDFYERLQVYVNSLAETHFPISPTTFLQGLASFKRKRLQTLENHIDRAFALLAQCEEQAELAATPTEKARLDLEIRKINENLVKYQAEYEQLTKP